MSRKQLKNRLTSDLPAVETANSESDSDFEGGCVNAFAALAEREVGDQSDGEQETTRTDLPVNSNAKKSKKKKKCKKAPDDKAANAENEEIDKLIEIYAPDSIRNGDASSSDAYIDSMSSPLRVDLKKINPDLEMRQLLGAKFKVTVSESAPWPPFRTAGLSMKLVKEESGIKHFVFEHGAAYKEVQHLFWEAVESMNHEALFAILAHSPCPYHLDSLLQCSDALLAQGDFQQARTLIERALYACDVAAHAKFNAATAECRLSYDDWENRAMFLAMFKHISGLCQRACYGTALEFAKILFHLDPDKDPLAVVLIMDYLALKSKQYDFVEALVKHLHWRNLDRLPNYAYSLALAEFLRYKATDEKKHLEAADQLIESALFKFPTLLMPLLDACQVAPDRSVESCSAFAYAERHGDGKGLQQLIELYVWRCATDLWNDPPVLQWLETNVHRLLPVFNAGDSAVFKEFRQIRRSQFPSLPRPILRHLFLSKGSVSSDISVQSADPFPPADDKRSYSPPVRQAAMLRGGALAAFLRSLLPNFEPDDLVDDGQQGEGGVQAALQQVVQAVQQMAAEFQVPLAPREDQMPPDQALSQRVIK